MIDGRGALARLAAEAALIRTHRLEYTELAMTVERADAIRRLVRSHRSEYDDLVARRARGALARGYRTPFSRRNH